MSEGSVDIDNLIQKAGNWVINKISPGGFPYVPDKPSDYYFVDTTQKPEKVEKSTESKDTLFKNWEEYLRKIGRIPSMPGSGVPINLIESPMMLLGNEIQRGAAGRAFIDENDHTFSKLWEYMPDEKWAKQNELQKNLYRESAGKHPWFTFIREFPGGWSQETISNQGNLSDYLRNGGKLSKDQIESAVKLLQQAHEITKQAQGDLIKHPKFLRSNARMEARDIENLKPFGYINVNNVLIDNNGEIHIIDYAGNPDPFPTAEPYSPQEKDSLSQDFCNNEAMLFEQGLQEILLNQQREPEYYQNIFATMDVVMAQVTA